MKPSVKRLVECEQLNILEILLEMPVDKCHDRELNARKHSAEHSARCIRLCCGTCGNHIHVYKNVITSYLGQINHKLREPRYQVRSTPDLVMIRCSRVLKKRSQTNR